jgi:hypothetical protein
MITNISKKNITIFQTGGRDPGAVSALVNLWLAPLKRYANNHWVGGLKGPGLVLLLKQLIFTSDQFYVRLYEKKSIQE